MGIIYNSLTPTEGLILSLDSANRRSYPGSGNIWFDLSGNGNNGSLVNGPTLATGPVGGMSFDGVNDYIDLNNSSLLNPTVGIASSLWVNRNSLSVDTWLISRDDLSLGRSFAFGIRGNASNNVVWLQINGGSTVLSTISVPLGLWTHLCFTRNSNNTYSIFINGALNSTSVSVVSPASTTGNVNIGRRTYSGFEGYFSGLLDDVRIYNRVLSPAEISILFNSKRMRYGL